MSSSDFKKELYALEAKRVSLYHKKEVAIKSRQAISDEKAELFLKTKTNKNKSYVEYLNKEQQLSQTVSETKIEALRSECERKVAIVQAALDNKNAWYSETIRKLIQDDVLPPSAAPSAIIARYEAELEEIDAKIPALKTTIDVLTNAERKAEQAEEEERLAARRAAVRAEIAAEKRKEQEMAEQERAENRLRMTSFEASGGSRSDLKIKEANQLAQWRIP